FHWIEDRQNIGAVLWRSHQWTVPVHRGESPIACDEVVQVLLVVHPITQRDDDIAFDALRPWRLGKGQFAFRDAIDPVAVVGKRHIAEPREGSEHLLSRLTGLDATPPRVRARRECPQRCGDRSGSLLPELMATDAARALHLAYPR